MTAWSACAAKPRVAAAKRSQWSAAFPVMTQRWSDLAYVHWPVDPAIVTGLLPADLELTVLPCINPWGYAHDRREDRQGMDQPVPVGDLPGPGQNPGVGGDVRQAARRAHRILGALVRG